MAVAWVSTGTLAGGTTADVTPVIPAHVADDLLLCLTASRATAETCLTPSTWNLIGTVNTTNWRLYFFWRRATAPGTTNPLCDWSAAGGEKYGVVHVLRGALTSASPIDVGTSTNANTTDPGAFGILTTTVADGYAAVVGLVADNVATAVTVTNPTDPQTWTQRSYTTIATGADAGQFYVDTVKPTAGALGTISGDFNGAPLAWGVVRLAVLAEPPPRVVYTDKSHQPLLAQ